MNEGKIFEKEVVKDKREEKVERLIEEIYGENALENFRDISIDNPDWPLRKRIEYFRENPTNVQTSFFREGNLNLISEEILDLFRKKFGKKRKMEILDAGCSSGKEPTSLAIQLLEEGEKNFQIKAIDSSSKLIKEARQGEYKIYQSLEGFKRMDAYYPRLKRNIEYKDCFQRGYFEDTKKFWQRRKINPKYTLRELVEIKKEKGKYPSDNFIYVDSPIIKVSDSVKEHIDYQKHDILKKPLKEKVDVAIVNNLLMHYPAKSRERILKNILASLNLNGWLTMEPERGTMNEYEKEWLTPYYEWRQKEMKKFGLEKSETGYPWLWKKVKEV